MRSWRLHYYTSIVSIIIILKKERINETKERKKEKDD